MNEKKQQIADIKIDSVRTQLVEFIKNTVNNAGYKKVILGLSGGVDSATVAFLSKEALGTENVIAVLMPYGKVDPDSVRYANKAIEQLKIKKYLIDIAPAVDAYFKNFPDADHIRRGNKMARERMSILYDLSKKENRISLLETTVTSHGIVIAEISTKLDFIIEALNELKKELKSLSTK